MEILERHEARRVSSVVPFSPGKKRPICTGLKVRQIQIIAVDHPLGVGRGGVEIQDLHARAALHQRELRGNFRSREHCRQTQHQTTSDAHKLHFPTVSLAASEAVFSFGFHFVEATLIMRRRSARRPDFEDFLTEGREGQNECTVLKLPARPSA